MDKPGHLQINLLGKPTVRLDSQLLTNFSTLKTEALLYYLADTRQIHSRETLAGLLWGEMPEATARRNLTKSLTVLRRLLGPFLVIERQRVGFKPEAAVELDVRQFTTAVKTNKQIAKALDLYCGDFLEGFFVKDTFAFEEWSLNRRDQLREMAVQALDNAVNQALNERNYATGIRYSRRLLALDPWRESAHRQLMLLLARHGQQAAALAQYELCCAILAEELGVEPMPETTALYARLQLARQDRPTQLPAAATPFVGREEELKAISRLLAEDGCRLVTLVGLGGIGKTRLALASAQQANQEQSWQFLHGVLYVSLTAVSTPEMFASAIMDALELSPDGRQDPIHQLNQFLHDKEMLLILDNFEHLMAATPVLNRLLQANPDIKFLITSREPLKIEAEHRFDVGGLVFPNEQETEAASNIQDYPAVQLFLQAARQVNPAFTIDNNNISDIRHICRTLAGIPLALRLAASWLRALTSAEIAAEIKKGLDLLATTMRDLPSRQRSMTAVFDHSWALLSASEQTCLAALSVFRDGFSPQAARQITGATLVTLVGLVDRSLLHKSQLPTGTRYHLHELTRQYAAEKLDQTPETAVPVRTAHTRFYAALLAALTPELSGEAPRKTYDQIHLEMGNIRLAWQHAVATADLESVSLCLEPLYRFYIHQGWFNEGQAAFATAVAALHKLKRRDTPNKQALAGLLARQGGLLARIGQFDPAETAFRQSIQQAREIGAPLALIFSLLELGTALRDQSRFDEAAQAFQESLEIAEELNDQPLLAQATGKMGIITWDQGSHLAAQELLVKALTLFRKQRNTRQIAAMLNSLGNVTMSMGNNKAALEYYQEALPIARELGDWLFLDTVLINLGMINNEMDQPAQAYLYYEESLGICRRIGDEIGVAYCLTGIGQVKLQEGDYGQARNFFKQSLTLNQTMGRDRYVAINLYLLGDVALSEKDWPAARAAYEESLAVSQSIPHRWGMASSRLRLGDLAVAQADEAAAGNHYLQALLLGLEIEAQGIVLTAVTNLAARLLKQADVETAVFILKIVENQPTVSASLRQTIENLLAQDKAQLSKEVQKQLSSKAQGEPLTTAVTEIQARFQPSDE